MSTSSSSDDLGKILGYMLAFGPYAVYEFLSKERLDELGFNDPRNQPMIKAMQRAAIADVRQRFPFCTDPLPPED